MVHRDDNKHNNPSLRPRRMCSLSVYRVYGLSLSLSISFSISLSRLAAGGFVRSQYAVAPQGRTAYLYSIAYSTIMSFQPSFAEGVTVVSESPILISPHFRRPVDDLFRYSRIWCGPVGFCIFAAAVVTFCDNSSERFYWFFPFVFLVHACCLCYFFSHVWWPQAML